MWKPDSIFCTVLAPLGVLQEDGLITRDELEAIVTWKEANRISNPVDLEAKVEKIGVQSKVLPLDVVIENAGSDDVLDRVGALDFVSNEARVSLVIFQGLFDGPIFRCFSFWETEGFERAGSVEMSVRMEVSLDSLALSVYYPSSQD
ncbi:hypothetical protein FIBSPDRAFT_966688 [Athelia psychrophila]|uniref:Uncharacterized protein n=1 Tax=Athelia psychrophila TaxID=1759441 RepID=A0A167WJX7_9AGAM|nr:hypothetical protein FIBSPDRAFT_966688 [Fibularhizoctonia sp. CBS 109695]